MTVEKLDHLEERIQKPAYLLFVVVILLFLIIGLVNLIDDVSRDPVLFGRYSIKYFGLLLMYTMVVLAWASLLLRPNDDRWLTKSLDFVQRRPPLAIAILTGIGLVFVAMLVPKQRIHKVFLDWPALQATVFVILLLTAGLILFYNWGNKSQPQLWRKVIVALLAFLLIVELIIQLLAYLGALPTLTSTSTTDGFAPYSRIYQTDEGFGNGIANKYGRYTPDFQLLPDSRRVALVGDSFVQALQVKADQDFGVVLQQFIDENGQEEQPTEILTLGYPDYGPGMYLSNWMLAVVTRVFKPDEVIIFFDLGSDFQTVDGPGKGVPYFEYTGQGKVALNLDDFFKDIHNKEHEVIYGHEGFQLTRIIGSNYLTPRVVAKLLEEPKVQAAAAAVPSNADINLENGFVFNENTNDEPMLVAKGLIYMAQEQLAIKETDTTLVTIPVFTEEFFTQEAWNTGFGASDLLLPERELRRFAEFNGIPFLGLGTYMAASGLTPEDVQKLYFENGRGHFTPAGHEFAAEAVYQCFFAQTLTPAEGCDLQ